jgi:hypothetical protein
MSKPSQKKREKQRKKKSHAVARQRRRGLQAVLPYEGNRFKSDAYIPAVFATECGIFEGFVAMDRKLTDDDVAASLTSMIRDLRQGTIRPLPDPDRPETLQGEYPSPIEQAIRKNWDDFAARGGRLSRDEQIGILRTLLNSINIFGSGQRASRGYLSFVEGLMTRAGVEVLPCDEHGSLLDNPGESKDPEMEELTDLADDWLTGEPEARRPFFDLARHLIRQGRGREVGEAARSILGQYDTGTEMPLISVLALEADNSPSKLSETSS